MVGFIIDLASAKTASQAYAENPRHKLVHSHYLEHPYRKTTPKIKWKLAATYFEDSNSSRSNLCYDYYAWSEDNTLKYLYF